MRNKIHHTFRVDKNLIKKAICVEFYFNLKFTFDVPIELYKNVGLCSFYKKKLITINQK